MNKRYIKIFGLAFAAVACQESVLDQALLDANNEMLFNVQIPAVHTKVMGDVFEESDVIGLYVTDYLDDRTPMPLQVSGNRVNNMAVTYDGAIWKPEKKVWWGEGKSDVYAYYPYMTISDVESQYFEVATDQNMGGYESSDFLCGHALGVEQIDGVVNLNMKHVMSKLTVKIVAGEDYVGSLPSDASVLLHSTVVGSRVSLTKGSASKDPYSSTESIKMKKLGLRTYDGYEAVVYEAIVVPQMLETIVPLIEINSKSVSYLLEDSFTFRPGVAYTYTATLNTSTTAIKVDIGCELEDWNSAGGDEPGEGEDGGDSGDGEDGDKTYVDLSSDGTANCYLIQTAGDYKFKHVMGNVDVTVGNVKSVEVLWESFGTDEKPNVGDIISSVSYNDGYVYFSTSENFSEGNAVIAAKNSKGMILWSWHIWCSEEGWQEHVYYNNAGTMMDRNLGATSATPGDIGALGLVYQWGRKDPFLGTSSISSSNLALSTGTWNYTSGGTLVLADTNPMTFYTSLFTNDSWTTSESSKSVCDPCPVGWRVPDGGPNGVWAKASGEMSTFSSGELWDADKHGSDFTQIYGPDESIWYPAAGYRTNTAGAFNYVGTNGSYWSANLSPTNSSLPYYMSLYNSTTNPAGNNISRPCALSVRCSKE